MSAILSKLESPLDVMVGRIREFHAHITSQSTATEALVSWCEQRRIGLGPIRARVLEQKSFGCRGSVIYRRSQLIRGSVVLSNAQILFRTDVLDDEMLERLAARREPFGDVVKSLRPWRTVTRARAAYNDIILALHATVRIGSGRPIARVHEAYHRGLIERIV